MSDPQMIAAVITALGAIGLLGRALAAVLHEIALDRRERRRERQRQRALASEKEPSREHHDRPTEEGADDPERR